MIRDEVRAYFAELPGMHGLVQAALSGWHGRVMPLRNGAVIAVGDFLICGGDPGREGHEALEAALLSQPRDWLIYAPGPWLEGLNRRGGFQPVKRRGFQPLQPGCRRESPCAKALPAGYTMGIMDAADARECLEAAWSRDFVREHGTAEKFVERGLGVLIRDGDGRPAAGASAYVSWPGGAAGSGAGTPAYGGLGRGQRRIGAYGGKARLSSRRMVCGLDGCALTRRVQKRRKKKSSQMLKSCAIINIP